MKDQGIIVVGVTILALFGLCEPARSLEGMVSYWRFEEGVGPTAHASVGGNDGTLIGGASFTAGIVGGALSVDRADYVDVSDAPNLNFDPASPMTVELWAYKTSPALVQHILGKREACIASRINYQMADVDPESPYPFARGLHFNNRAGDSSVSEVATGVNLSLDTWTHLADGSTLRFYIDGGVAGSATGTLGATTTGPFRMGTSGTCSAGFGGLIDEVAIYDRALTIEEIQQHYQNGLNGVGYLAIEVEIDIKPGSDPNPINPSSNGLVPVAILSSKDFDATTVDPTTVQLAGASVAVRGKGEAMAHQEDVNGDGLTDLVVQVETQSFADLGEGGTVELTGTTFGGQAIIGYDDVIVVPPEQ